jgi:hypothetical protein
MPTIPTSRSGPIQRAVALLPILCACATWGCLGLRARAVTAPEPLDMPEPPPRVVEVREPEAVPPPISLPEEPVRNTPTRPRPTPEPARTTETPRIEPPPADAVKPEESAPRPPATLQTTPTLREQETLRRIQAILNQASSELNRINYQSLTAEGQGQYDQAKRLISQAEEAVKARNLPFASNIAEKAATLATQLAGR